jgi:ribosome-associated protein YbcJ (S4-like RNA binding protein)
VDVRDFVRDMNKNVKVNGNVEERKKKFSIEWRERKIEKEYFI